MHDDQAGFKSGIMVRKPILLAVLLALVLVILSFQGPALAQEQSGGREFLKKARNPLDDQISFQIQPNFNFGGAPDRDTQYVFNLQPVVPINLSADWLLFSRTILPLIDQPGSESGQGYTFGIGDIQETLILSPPSSKTFIWGLGSVLQFPSASATSLGTGKWEMGPIGAAVFTSKWWQLTGQIYNLWSYAGDASRPAVNTMFLQPVLNVFLPRDWYLTFGPQVTANWKASAGNKWTVPVGGGIGRAFSIASKSGIAQVEAYNYVERPSGSATWTVILTVQFVFPE